MDHPTSVPLKRKEGIYFERYAFPAITDDPLDGEIEMVVVIPSFKEPGIAETVSHLLEHPTETKVMILVVVNEAEHSDANIQLINKKSIEDLQSFEVPDTFHLKVGYQRFPERKAGVGMARKAGMDQAARWFHDQNRTGFIVCFDADCRCDPNYFDAISEKFARENLEAAVISYEHPLENEWIVEYELYLRYYVDALRWAGYPFSCQTLGSCMAVRSDAYIKMGGMNTRQAGEDFYFLHKIIRNVRFGEINDTTVYPSDRISDRVPFGTGKAIKDARIGKDRLLYNPESYEIIQSLIDGIHDVYMGLNPFKSYLKAFLESENFEMEMAKLRNNSTSMETFQKFFFQWFDGFKVMKLLHYLRAKGLNDVPVSQGISWLNEHYYKLNLTGISKEDLIKIRNQNRQGFEYGLLK